MAIDSTKDQPNSSQVTSTDTMARRTRHHVDWLRCIPFFLMHIAAIAVLWVGISGVAVAVAGLVFAVRVFGLTAFYHRYFSHRAFRTTRWFQFCGAVLGSAAAQRGPLWWCAHHRHHHTHSDRPGDAHSPVQHGFWFSHMGWFLTRENYPTEDRLIKDWLRFPELRLLDRFEFFVPSLLALAMFGLGWVLSVAAPGLGTSGWQMVVWGFLLSTLALYHVTYSVNSLAHTFGTRRFETKDDSRNNWWVALMTFGEGWHNNHHRYPAAARQGFFWWEIDLTYYGLLLLSRLGLVWGLKPVPAHVLAEGDAGRSSGETNRNPALDPDDSRMWERVPRPFHRPAARNDSAITSSFVSSPPPRSESRGRGSR